MEFRAILLSFVIIAGLLAACQPATEQTPPLPTATPLSPTDTPVPPSETPVPTPTPTETATPTAAAKVKGLIEWADLGTGKGPAYSQDWSPDGLTLVTADTDQIRVWDVTSPRSRDIDRTFQLYLGIGLVSRWPHPGFRQPGWQRQAVGCCRIYRDSLPAHRLGDLRRLVSGWRAVSCGRF